MGDASRRRKANLIFLCPEHLNPIQAQLGTDGDRCPDGVAAFGPSTIGMETASLAARLNQGAAGHKGSSTIAVVRDLSIPSKTRDIWEREGK